MENVAYEPCGRLIRVSGVCRVRIAITCDRLEWGKAYMQSDNDRLAKFAGDLIPIFSSIRVTRSVTLLVRTSLPTFDPIPKPYIVCLSLRARNERSDASNAFPKLLILTIFFVAIPNLHASFSFAYATRTITLEHGDHVWM